MQGKLKRYSALALILLPLAACSSTGGTDYAKGYKEPPPPPGLGQFTEFSEGHFKIGRPYKIKGRWYYPKHEDNYVEEGVASWYGPKFHGRKTANGALFDQYQISAAHRTLPLPSIVRVTNLENGKVMKIKVNDRGPFARDRIIDLSMRAAEMLGFRNQGTARVRVEYLDEDTKQFHASLRKGSGTTLYARREVPAFLSASTGEAQLAGGQSQAAAKSTTEAKPPATADEETSKAAGDEQNYADARQPVEKKPLFVQAGAFSVKENASRLASSLNSLAEANIIPAFLEDREIYRVRLGPVSDGSHAQLLINELAALGLSGARIIAD